MYIRAGFRPLLSQVQPFDIFPSDQCTFKRLNRRALELAVPQELGHSWRDHILVDPGPVLGSATIAQVSFFFFKLI